MAFFCQASIHFPEALSIGCLIHWIQPMWKKGVKLGIPKNVKFAMHVSNLLNVIPNKDIHPRGTTYVAGKVIDFLCMIYG